MGQARMLLFLRINAQFLGGGFRFIPSLPLRARLGWGWLSASAL